MPLGIPLSEIFLKNSRKKNQSRQKTKNILFLILNLNLNYVQEELGNSSGHHTSLKL